MCQLKLCCCAGGAFLVEKKGKDRTAWTRHVAFVVASHYRLQIIFCSRKYVFKGIFLFVRGDRKFCKSRGRLSRGKVDSCQRPFHDVFRVPFCLEALFEFQKTLFKCIFSEELVLNNLIASSLLKPYFTPGGWHEANCLNWKVSVGL